MMRLLLLIWKSLHLPKSVQLLLMRFMQDEFLVGVSGIIFNEKNEILLFQHTYRDQEWGLPGGYLKRREHPKEGLEREIKEETNLVVAIDERLKIRTDRDTARLDITYAGTFIGGEFNPSKEVIAAKFFAFDELPRLPNHQLMLVEKILRRRESKRRFWI